MSADTKHYFNIEGIDCLSRFWFLSRFCLNGEGRKEGRKFQSLEVRASISHLKMSHPSTLKNHCIQKKDP